MKQTRKGVVTYVVDGGVELRHPADHRRLVFISYPKDGAHQTTKFWHTVDAIENNLNSYFGWPPTGRNTQ